MLEWLAEIFEDNFWKGLGIFFGITMGTVPLNIPYTMSGLLLAYCMARRFGTFAGFIVDALIDPIIFAIASIVPFVMTRLCCKNSCGRILLENMRVIKALEASFDKHGIKIVSIFRMIPGNKMSQNYLLAVTKLRFSQYMIGTYLGGHAMSIMTAYIGTQI